MSTTRSLTADQAVSSQNQAGSASTPSAHLALMPTWLPTGQSPVSDGSGASSTADQGSPDGGDGLSVGTIRSAPSAVFVPDNMALSFGDTTGAYQANHALVDQRSAEIAGSGGDGGTTYEPGASAGGGGNGTFLGGMVSADVGVFAPVNTAVAVGSGAHAESVQLNDAVILQDTTQIGGTGGAGGNSYGGGGAAGATIHVDGDLHAGSGGAGYFVGTMTDINVAIFSPINIAVAGAGGTAHAEQDNNAVISQGATQIGGIGGSGGSFFVPSDTIVTGIHGEGASGQGEAVGSFVGVNVSYVEPINIAVPADGTAQADQINHLIHDQHTVQVAGVGGEPGTYHLLDDDNAAALHDALGFADG